jgi:hypothetical protein
MPQIFHRSAALVLLAFSASAASAADWITAPSYYTHDPQTAQRVNQFSPVGPFYVYTPPNYVKSGYRHLRSTIQAGGSADNLHIVEEWGRPVIPYEQWRFPARPYGSPYPNWGPPYAGAAFFNGFGPVPYGGGGGFGGGPGYGGGPGGGGPGYGGGYGPGGYGGGPGGGYSPYYQMNGPAPWLDGYWPSYDVHDRSDYYRPYNDHGWGRW